MNRFVLDTDPVVAARYHCDKHVVKMIVEEAQMLSTVHRQFGSFDERLYRATHRHHPCTVWAGASTANYEWAYRLFVELCAEYTRRYKRVHATARLLAALVSPPAGVPVGGLTSFPQAMPEVLRGDDPVVAYRLFYMLEKARFARWTGCEVPSWFVPVELGNLATLR